MLKQTLLLSALTSALVLTPMFALASDQEHTQGGVQKQDQISGSQLMTRQERSAFHAKMRAAKTDEEREQIRNEHHERMKIRAKERGVTLPDMPPPRGMGMGGMAPGGGGMGPGGGGRTP